MGRRPLFRPGQDGGRRLTDGEVAPPEPGGAAQEHDIRGVVAPARLPGVPDDRPAVVRRGDGLDAAERWIAASSSPISADLARREAARRLAPCRRTGFVDGDASAADERSAFDRLLEPPLWRRLGDRLATLRHL